MQTTQHLHVRSLSMYPPPPSSLKRWRDTREQSTFSLQKIRQESSVEISGAFQNKSKWNEDFLSQYVTSTALGRSLSELHCAKLSSISYCSFSPSICHTFPFLQLHLHYTSLPPPPSLSPSPFLFQIIWQISSHWAQGSSPYWLNWFIHFITFQFQNLIVWLVFCSAGCTFAYSVRHLYIVWLLTVESWPV